MRIAIIGSGISGLTAAHHLSRDHEVTVFEKNDYAGGHSHTVPVEDGGRELALDTGFIVYNERTYPRFTELLARLGLVTLESEMSFSVACRRCGIEYAGKSLRSLFARPRQILRPRFHRMLFEILRFNRLGSETLRAGPPERQTLGGFLAERQFSREFVRHYLIPMGAAIWSSKSGTFGEFPLGHFLRFFDNHGLLTVHDHPVWRTITGGSRKYVKALTRGFSDRIRLSSPVASVRRRAGGVEIRLACGSSAAFDRVVLATHSDQALALLSDPSEAERGALRAIPYQPNEATLHTDASVLPRRAAARASWNVHMEDCRRGEAPLSMTYSLNRLQKLETSAEYCVTLNDGGSLDSRRILRRIAYEHPVYTHETLSGQDRLRSLSGERNTYYCGAYLGYGFHEDGVRSGLEVAAAIGKERAAA